MKETSFLIGYSLSTFNLFIVNNLTGTFATIYVLVKINMYFRFKLFHLLDNNLLGHKADDKRKINIEL